MEQSNHDFSALHHYAHAQDHHQLQAMSDFTFEVLDTICQFVKPGVKESEVINYCYQTYEKMGVERIWHKPFIRFGKHTITTFRQLPKEDLTLQEEDIAYVDIGIVKNGIEGDAGRTLCFGDNSLYHDIVLLTKELFEKGKAYFQLNEVTGIALYDYIEKLANEKGFEINLKPAGHLIGSFPHTAAKYNNGLSRFPDLIEPYQWILEVQIRHPSLEVGGFYECILA